MFRFVALIFLLFLTACGSPTPPTSFAPGGEIVKSAIALSLNLTQEKVTKQLNASDPNLGVSQINVKNIEPIYIGHLPTYHLEGTYNLKIGLPEQEVTQKDNPFDIYIQRQKEGKSWRLVKRETDSEGETQWLTYFIHHGSF